MLQPYVRGLLHILHNTEGSSIDSIQMSKELFEGSLHCADLFKHRHVRELFVSECVPDDMVDIMDIFATRPEHYIHWRWGTLIETIARLRMCRTVLSFVFDDQKMKNRFEELCRADSKARDARKAQDK